MRILVSGLCGAFLMLTASLVTAAPEFPGLDQVMEGSQLDIDRDLKKDVKAQREQREKMEEFARQLKAWWWAENKQKPMPYIQVGKKRVKLSKKFMQAYMKSRKNKTLKADWVRVEARLQKMWKKKKG